MLKNILKLKGIQELSKAEQQTIKGEVLPISLLDPNKSCLFNPEYCESQGGVCQGTNIDSICIIPPDPNIIYIK